MSASSTAYELMIKSLLETKFKAEGLGKLQGFHLKKYKGKSGQDHEIDVSFAITIANVPLLLLVECKEHKRKVGVEDILTFSYRLRDIGAHKGLLVTTTGFQAGVEQVAKAERIALLIAVNGNLVSQSGAMGVVYIAKARTGDTALYDRLSLPYHQLGIIKLRFEVSDDGADFRLIGERLVASRNESWLAVRFGEGLPLLNDRFQLSAFREALMFLLPAEETTISPKSPESSGYVSTGDEQIQWGRPLAHRGDTDRTVIL